MGDIGVLVLAMLDSQTLLTNKYVKIKVIMLHNFATILELDKEGNESCHLVVANIEALPMLKQENLEFIKLAKIACSKFWVHGR